MGTVDSSKKTAARVSHNNPDVGNVVGGWILLSPEEPYGSSSCPFPQNGGLLLPPVERSSPL